MKKSKIEELKNQIEEYVSSDGDKKEGGRLNNEIARSLLEDISGSGGGFEAYAKWTKSW